MNKPDRHIFDMAIHKAELGTSDIWYCGNDMAVDIVGAHNAGILPVFYDDRSVPSKIHEKMMYRSWIYPVFTLTNGIR